jgi:hypothetical protein
MGYSTYFRGKFKLEPSLNAAQCKTLTKFSQTRHGYFHTPYEGYPGFHCDWVPTEEGDAIVHDGTEKFTEYDKWLQLLIDRFFKPWGIAVSGKVLYQGESIGDVGWLSVENQTVKKEPL